MNNCTRLLTNIRAQEGTHGLGGLIDKIRHFLPMTTLVGLLVAGAFTLVGQAHAQSPGVNRADLVKQLVERHSETPVARGLGSNGGMFEVFSSKDGETWTIIMTTPDGKSYLLGAGEFWATFPHKDKGSKI